MVSFIVLLIFLGFFFLIVLYYIESKGFHLCLKEVSFIRRELQLFRNEFKAKWEASLEEKEIREVKNLEKSKEFKNDNDNKTSEENSVVETVVETIVEPNLSYKNDVDSKETDTVQQNISRNAGIEINEERKCTYYGECLKEIITTEASYVHDLALVQELFIVPLASPKYSKLLSAEDFERLFGLICEILNLNRSFLIDLRTCIEDVPKESDKRVDYRDAIDKDSSPKTVGEVFLKYAEFFKMYAPYCANHSNSILTLNRLQQKNKAFSVFLNDAMRNPRCRQLPLESFLSLPISRICKYPLLLSQLLKYASRFTDKELSMLNQLPCTISEYETLRKAYDKLSSVVSMINQRRTTLERIERVREISQEMDGVSIEAFELVKPSRILLMESDFLLWQSTRYIQKPVMVFLFNDILIITKERQPMKRNLLFSSILRKKRFKYLAHVDLTRGIIREKDDSKEIMNGFELLCFQTKRIFVLISPTLEQKVKWMNQLMDIISINIQRSYESFKKNKISMQKEAGLIRTNRFSYSLNCLKQSQASSVCTIDHYDKNCEDILSLERDKIEGKVQESMYKEGYLEKLHGNLWIKRFFILDDGILTRFDTKGGKQIGKISLKGCYIKEYLPEINKYCFEIRQMSNHRKVLIKDSNFSLISKRLVLRAEDEKHMFAWLNAFLKQRLWLDGDLPVKFEKIRSESISNLRKRLDR